jgi:hypothetical protein
MEDKTFELFTRLYNEISDFRKEVNMKLDQKADKSDIAIIEYEYGSKLKVALVGNEHTYEKLNVIENKLDILSGKVDRHDIKIQAVEGGRK